MTNQDRQQSIDNKYNSHKETRGKAPWCTVCKHRMPNGGCRMKKEKATEECICATSYNRFARK